MGHEFMGKSYPIGFRGGHHPRNPFPATVKVALKRLRSSTDPARVAEKSGKTQRWKPRNLWTRSGIRLGWFMWQIYRGRDRKTRNSKKKQFEEMKDSTWILNPKSIEDTASLIIIVFHVSTLRISFRTVVNSQVAPGQSDPADWGVEKR